MYKIKTSPKMFDFRTRPHFYIIFCLMYFKSKVNIKYSPKLCMNFGLILLVYVNSFNTSVVHFKHSPLCFAMVYISRTSFTIICRCVTWKMLSDIRFVRSRARSHTAAGCSRRRTWRRTTHSVRALALASTEPPPVLDHTLALAYISSYQ